MITKAGEDGKAEADSESVGRRQGQEAGGRRQEQSKQLRVRDSRADG